MKKLLSPYVASLVIAIGMALYFGISFICRLVFGMFDIEEIGATETLTYLFYGFGGGIIFCCAKDFIFNKTLIKSFIAIVVLYLIMILRDMGAQHWLTAHDTTITKIRFFTNPANPIYEKIIAAVVMIIVIAVLLYVFIKHIKPFLKGLIKFESVSWTTLTFFVWIVITQVADRLPAEFLKATGSALSEPMLFSLKILEEGGESLLPIIIAVGMLQFKNIYCKK